MSGDLDGHVTDLDARLRRVEAIIDTAKRIMAANSGLIENALVELDACDAADRSASSSGPCGTCWPCEPCGRARGPIAP